MTKLSTTMLGPNIAKYVCEKWVKFYYQITFSHSTNKVTVFFFLVLSMIPKHSFYILSIRIILTKPLKVYVWIIIRVLISSFTHCMSL